MYIMKKVALIIVVVVVSTASLWAQNYAGAMQNALAKMGAAKSTTDFVAASQIFERITQVETAKWEPAYYAALSLINGSYTGQEKEKRDQMLDQAQKFIDTCLKRSPENSEAMTLQGYLYQARIGVDGSRGQEFSPKAAGALKQAMAWDANNPRATSLMAMNVFYTPSFYGGGKEYALPLFEKAEKLFAEQPKSSSFAPSWGEEMNQHFLQECKK
jgi:hypothetical protein